MSKRVSDKILERLLTLHPKIIDLSLIRMNDILNKLENPQNSLPPTIHVAGTNGKGSTIAYLWSILEAAGLSVHIYTSPHLVRFAERIRLNGKIIEETYLQEILEHCEKINAEEPITYFEITTAAAFKAFADNPADVLILEVGLGGRLDATNVVDKPLSTVITPISHDHEQFLGNDLSIIAMEKASIAKKNTPLLSAKQQRTVADKINEITDKNGGKLITDWDYNKTNSGFNYNDHFGSLNLPAPNLSGPHQISNAALAVAVLRHQTTLKITDDCYKKGVTNANWPARMQNITDSPFGKSLAKGSELWLDGGHNPAAGIVVADTFKDQEIILICGMMENKDTARYLKKLAPLTKYLYGVHVDGEASHPAIDIVKFAWANNITAETAQSVEQALAKIGTNTPSKVVICGSLYLAGQVLRDNDLIPD
ncbi:MAG: bifunctional folylpolyglutamate synthase/dihydrofolate synthase [Emcibacteraceae bacterium]|nr:bifunctional folylpolyglutamate synthase/dihydrofolate synthase [Emcibacteraceae bacterium]